MTPILALALLLSGTAASPAPATEAPARVTIYTHGSWASESHPLTRNGIFLGGIWVDGEPVCQFIDSLIPRNNRYIVLSLSSGTHVLGTGSGHKPEKDSLYRPVFLPGEHIYLRVHAEENALGTHSHRFEPVPCTTASQELQHATVLGPRAIRKEQADKISEDQSLPVCP